MIQKGSLAAVYRGWVLDSWLSADGWIEEGDLGSRSSVDDRLFAGCAIGVVVTRSYGERQPCQLITPGFSYKAPFPIA
jgi:hypothetical protein